MKKLKTDRSWTLFLDRDGVINRRIPGGYVTCPEEFQFLPGSLEAMPLLRERFGRVIIVTNQKGVGKKLMTATALAVVHDFMLAAFERTGAVPDAVYAATGARLTATSDHKPNPGLALRAQKAYPDIDFQKSVMVGDSLSDMAFGLGLGMQVVLVKGKEEEAAELAKIGVSGRISGLGELINFLAIK